MATERKFFRFAFEGVIDIEAETTTEARAKWLASFPTGQLTTTVNGFTVIGCPDQKLPDDPSEKWSPLREWHPPLDHYIIITED